MDHKWVHFKIEIQTNVEILLFSSRPQGPLFSQGVTRPFVMLSFQTHSLELYLLTSRLHLWSKIRDESGVETKFGRKQTQSLNVFQCNAMQCIVICIEEAAGLWEAHIGL